MATDLKYAEENKQKRDYDLSVLQNEQIQKALDGALEMYYFELVGKGYSPLTVGTYCSDAGRFVEFLKQGRKSVSRTQ